MNPTTPNSQVPKKIFISYPHKTDAHVALMQKIRKLLEQRGYATWLDGDELKVGDDWRSRIVEGLLETDFVLAFLSKHSMRDPGVCRNEISLTLHAKSSDDLLITALLEAEGVMHAPLTLAHIQPVDLTDFETLSLELNSPEGMQKLEDAVDQLVQRMESGKNVAGNMAILRKRLQPASYIAEIAQKSAVFEGRKWLFEEIQTWQDDFNAPRVFALQGSAGVGKSAISAHLTNYRSSVFGIHFCKYNDVSTHSTNNLVRTMAFQLASRHKVYSAKLIHAVADDKYSDDKIFNIPGEQLFDDLIIDLTQTIAVTDDERKMFIVDGLDEATVNGENAILELISTKFSALPNWLGVLVTSRPEASIVDALPGTYVLNADDKRNQNDVRSYLTKGLGKVDVLAQDESLLNKAVDIASAKAAGVMLYASELLRALREGYINPLQPDEFPNGLGGLYFLSLQRHYPNKDQYYNGKPAVADLLELIAGSPLPITEQLLLGIADISSETLTSALAPLNTLLVKKPKSGEHADTIELFHKSFADWLLEDHAYQLNGDGATTIGEFLYQTFKSIENQDLSKVSSKYLVEIDTLLTLCLPAMAVWGETRELEKLWKWFFERGRYLAAIAPLKREVAIQTETLGERHPDTLTSMNNLARTLYEQGDLASARSLCEQVLTAFKATLGETHPNTLASMSSLASTLESLGDLTGARALHEQTLAACKTTLGSSHPSTLTSMICLASTLQAQGDLTEARMLYEQALAAQKATLGDTHPDTLTSMFKLASTLESLGDLTKACELNKLVLAARKKKLGHTHPDTLTSMSNLAGTLHARGDVIGACALYEQTLALFKETLGATHPETLISMNNLASTLYSQGDLNGARALLELVFAAHKETFGITHPVTLTSMSNLASVLTKFEDLDSARALNEQALAARKETFGELHPSTLSSMNNLASTLQAQGDLKGARAIHEKVLAARTETLSSTHPDTLISMNNLAGALYLQGDLTGARALHEQTLAARKTTLGVVHPDTIASMVNLAGTLIAQGDLTGARALFEQAMVARKATLGDAHPDTITIMSNLADTLAELEDWAGAQVIYEQVLAARKETLGENHPDTLASMTNLADTLAELEDWTGAQLLYEQALDAHKDALGDTHQETLAVMKYLAYTLQAQGDLSGAFALFEKALALHKETLGYAHPDTLTIMDNMAGTLYAQGDLAGARRLQEDILSIYKTLVSPNHPQILEYNLKIGFISSKINEHAYGLKYLNEVLKQIESDLTDEYVQELRMLEESLSLSIAEHRDGMEDMYKELNAILSNVVEELNTQHE